MTGFRALPAHIPAWPHPHTTILISRPSHHTGGAKGAASMERRPRPSHLKPAEGGEKRNGALIPGTPGSFASLSQLDRAANAPSLVSLGCEAKSARALTGAATKRQTCHALPSRPISAPDSGLCRLDLCFADREMVCFHVIA
jgi:hypothetical protein